MENKKKFILAGVVVALAVVCILATVLVNNSSSVKEEPKESEKISENVKEEDGKVTSELTLDEVKDKLSNKESFTLLLSQTECPYCVEFKEAINSNVDENNKVYVLEVDKLDLDELAKEYKTEDGWIAIEDILGMERDSFQYTPMTIGFKDGKLNSTLDKGDVDKLKEMMASTLPVEVPGK